MAVKIPSLARIFLLSAFLSSCVYQSNALCNGAAALLCCLNVVPATDPLAIAALALAGATALPTQQIGLVCVPALAETGILCLTKLAACDDNSHLALGIGCSTVKPA